jgi:hypothetical protein
MTWCDVKKIALGLLGIVAAFVIKALFILKIFRNHQNE